MLDEGVLGLGEDLDECVLVQRVEPDHDGDSAHELGDETVFDEVLGLQLGDELVIVIVLVALDGGAEAELGAVLALVDDLVEVDERAAAQEEDVGGVDLVALLVGVLSAALRRHGRHRPFDDLEERLLDALAADVAGDGDILALARDLVYLVDVDDAHLRLADVAVGSLDELQKDVLDVLADIARLGERCGVRNGEGDVENLRQRLCKQSLARAGGTEQKDVALFEHDAVVGAREPADALVVVIYGDAQHLFGAVLTDDVLIEFRFDLLRSVERDALSACGSLLCEQMRALLDALVANGHAVGADDDLFDLAVALAAETAMQLLVKIHITSQFP